MILILFQSIKQTLGVKSSDSVISVLDCYYGDGQLCVLTPYQWIQKKWLILINKMIILEKLKNEIDQGGQGRPWLWLRKGIIPMDPDEKTK